MISATTTLLTLILIRAWVPGHHPEFLVPDRKKSTIALVLSGVIIFMGLFQWMSPLSINSAKRRMGDFQRNSRLTGSR